MWSYNGKPLYTYAKDNKAGESVGSVWHMAKKS